MWCFKALLVPKITQGLLQKLQVFKSDPGNAKVLRAFQRLKKPPIFPWWENNSNWFCCFFGWTACRFHVWMITLPCFKGGCLLSSYKERRGCWEPGLLWEMFKQAAPGTVLKTDITNTGEVQHKQSLETSEMQFRSRNSKVEGTSLILSKPSPCSDKMTPSSVCLSQALQYRLLLLRWWRSHLTALCHWRTSTCRQKLPLAALNQLSVAFVAPK